MVAMAEDGPPPPGGGGGTGAPRLGARLAAAAGAGAAMSLVMNPLDVVRVRMQAGLPPAGRARVGAMSAHPAHCEVALPCPRLGTAYAQCPPKCTVPAAVQEALLARSPLAIARGLVRREGLASLWRGTDAALMMAVPAVAIYLPLYDALLDALRERGAGGAAPALSGAVARSAAVLATSPFEYVRTRVYNADAASGSASALGELRRALGGRTGPASLYTGVGATLLRDVPFSVVYWALLEPTRQRIAQRRAERGDGASVKKTAWDLAAHCGAAMLAGGFAALVTCPLDVVKTRLQLGNDAPGAIKPPPRTLAATAAGLIRDGGVRSLFAGWIPRVVRAAPACGITIASYEALLMRSSL